jgi:hypothetical protein
MAPLGLDLVQAFQRKRCMYSCLKFGIEISMLEEKSLMVLIVLGYTIKINI